MTFRISFSDFYAPPISGIEPLTTSFLRVPDTQVIADISRADLSVYSVDGTRHLSSRGFTLAFSGEPWFSPYTTDYTIDCRYRSSSTHFRLPYWACSDAYFDVPDDFTQSAPRFCNFMYTNPHCNTRNAFFQMLHARQPVDALAKVYANASDPRLSPRFSDAVFSSKRSVLADYRFTIAFENRELPGYTTEKLVDAWLAGSVPIYWGDPAFMIDFPEHACLSLYEAGSMNKLVEQVLEAEHEPERYAQLQAANPFRTGHGHTVLRAYRESLDIFTERIVSEMRISPRFRSARHRRMAARRSITRRWAIPIRKVLHKFLALS